MKFLLCSLVLVCFAVAISECRPRADVDPDEYAKAQSINQKFRKCLRACLDLDSRDAKTACTVQCSYKYPLPKLQKKDPSQKSK